MRQFSLRGLVPVSAIVLSLFYLFTWLSSTRSTTTTTTRQILADAAQTRLNQLQATFDDHRFRNELGLKIDNDDGLNQYTRDLIQSYQTYFAPQGTRDVRQDSVWKEIHDLLSVRTYRPPSDLPKRIITTSKEPVFPDQFETWATINPGWDVIYSGDDAIDAKIKLALKPFSTWDTTTTSARNASDPGRVRNSLLEAINHYHGVLKADIFRYLAMFLDGGVYTDVDTACVRPLDSWPGLVSRDEKIKSVMDPLLHSMPTLLQLCSGDSTTDVQVIVGSHDPPRLVIALEHDQWAQSNDWRQMGHSRGMQFVQWTLLSRPHHPVFLDVLGRVFKTIQTAEHVAAGKHEDSAKARKEFVQQVVGFDIFWTKRTCSIFCTN